MNQDNQFHQYGYDHYLKTPSKSGLRSRSMLDLPTRLIRKLRNPAGAMVSLAVVVVLFVTLLISSYPSGDDGQKQIPIIKADLRPIKTEPVQRGGMNIPHSDSTILARSSGRSSSSEDDMADQRQYIENLLSSGGDDLVSKEQAIEQAMVAEPIDVAVDEQEGINIIKGNVLGASEAVSSVATAEVSPIKEDLLDVVNVSDPVGNVQKAPEAENILQKIGETEKSDGGDSSEFIDKAAAAAVSVKPKKIKIHAAATSPDTLDFVRNILDEADDGGESNKASASASASLEPSVGAANSVVNITAGQYFVQLASISDPARAASEWSKMKARYNVLSNSKFRVQEASLSRGTFYRIQAGPMSKGSATKVCDALKAQGKSGGCLVVK